MKTNLINWSELSRLLGLDRNSIRSTYSGKKYARIVERVKKIESLLIKWIEKQKSIL